MKSLFKKVTTTKWFYPIRDTLILLCASILFATGAQLFILPNLLNIGGFLGIAQLIMLLPIKYLSTGIVFILLNIPLIAFSGIIFSRRFVRKTFFEVIFSGAIMDVFYRINLAQTLGLVSRENLTLIAVCGGFLIAVSAVATLYVNSANGGMDIVGLMIQKKYNISHISRIIVLFDIIVSLIYAFCINQPVTIFYSIATIAIHQITLELLLNGISNAVLCEIVTDNADTKDTLIQALMLELERGSTVFKAVGCYSQNEKDVIMCIVSKHQEAEARMIIHRIAPDSFAYSLAIKEVVGEGFKNIHI